MFSTKFTAEQYKNTVLLFYHKFVIEKSFSL